MTGHAPHRRFNDNEHSKDSSYPVDSKTLLGHAFPDADLSHCYWLPLRDLAYRKSRIASFGDFSHWDTDIC
jgi:hypothetical protein